MLSFLGCTGGMNKHMKRSSTPSMPHSFPTSLLPAGLHGAREGPENIRSEKAQKDVDLLPA